MISLFCALHNAFYIILLAYYTGSVVMNIGNIIIVKLLLSFKYLFHYFLIYSYNSLLFLRYSVFRILGRWLSWFVQSAFDGSCQRFATRRVNC